MHIVKCTLPNASGQINGVKFERVDGVMVSEPVPGAVAKNFAAIEGYTVEEVSEDKPADQPAAKKAAKKADAPAPAPEPEQPAAEDKPADQPAQ